MAVLSRKLPSRRHAASPSLGTRPGLPTYVLIMLVALISLSPFLYLVARSFGTANDQPVWFLIFQQMPVGTYMLNSAIVSLGATAVVLVTSSLAGYGFAKLSSPLSNTVYSLIVAAISVPLATIILPNYLNFAKLHGIGNYGSPIVIYAALATPFSTVLMTSFFRSLPDELMESAIIDGATYVQIFTHIMLRMAGPALVTVGVLAFLGSWNDLLIGLLFLPNPDMRTISVGVSALQAVRTNASDTEILMTGSLLSAVPPIVAYVLFQRYLVSGIVSGIGK